MLDARFMAREIINELKKIDEQIEIKPQMEKVWEAIVIAIVKNIQDNAKAVVVGGSSSGTHNII